MDKIGNVSLTLFQRPKVANLIMPFPGLKSFHCFLLPIPHLSVWEYMCACVSVCLCVLTIFFFLYCVIL